MSKENIYYKNMYELKPIETVINEASKAVEESDRIISSSDIPEILGAATGLGSGGFIGFAALYYAGVPGPSAVGITSGLATAGSIVGGGMTAGIGVLAAPAVVLGIGGYALLSRRKKKKLMEKKEILLHQAMQKHNAIIRLLRVEVNVNKERLEYLTSLNKVLQGIIADLKADLAATA
jgi:hypothetical protein